ncbi:MAG TPA: mechanosensitive ion channel family protein [Xanthobacteraceae bacterium]|nr:mechanosensitive ion channel family protein [Xanthobacteraceae bacterium]
MDQIVAWLEQRHIEFSTVFATVVLIVGATTIILLVNRLLKRWLQPAEARLGLRSEDIATLVRVITAILWFIALMVAFELWGVGIGGFWTVFVSAATIIGAAFVATWALVSNVTADLFITIWRPFRLGDTIELLPEKFKGRAVDRNLMFTVLREEDGCVLQVPNNLFFQKIFRVGRG